MRPIALAGSWLQIVATLTLFLAVVLRAGGPVSPFKSNDVSVPEAISLIEAGALVIDVRYSPSTHLPGALLIPMEVLGARLEKLEIAKTQPIVVYCGNGTARGPEASADPDAGRVYERRQPRVRHRRLARGGSAGERRLATRTGSPRRRGRSS